jgi:hypothetical protein
MDQSSGEVAAGPYRKPEIQVAEIMRQSDAQINSGQAGNRCRRALADRVIHLTVAAV